MTVKQLIEQLSKFPPEMRVGVMSGVGDNDSLDDLAIHRILDVHNEFSFTEDYFVSIEINREPNYDATINTL